MACGPNVPWLLLDTESGSPGEHLYAACGWTRFGIVPGHSMTPDGLPKPTSFFYKILADAPVDLPLNGSTSGDVP